MRETVRDGEPALAVDTEEEFARALGSGVYVVPPSWADAMAWHPWDEENTDSLEDVLATDDDPDPTQEDASAPPRMVLLPWLRPLVVGLSLSLGICGGSWGAMHWLSQTHGGTMAHECSIWSVVRLC